MKTVTRDGTLLVQVCGLEIAFFAPSRERVGMLIENPLLPLLNVIVHADEEQVYAREADRFGSLRTHRIENHLPRIHNRMLAEMWAVGPDAVVRVDDDLVGLRWNFSLASSLRKFTALEEIVGIVASSATLGLEAGAGFVGYERRPRFFYRNALTPFSLRTWVTTQLAVATDERVRALDEIPVMEDLTTSLVSLELTGMCIMDHRFIPMSRGDRKPGGIMAYRTPARIQAAAEYLADRYPGVYTLGDGYVEPGSGLPYGRLRVPQ